MQHFIKFSIFHFVFIMCGVGATAATLGTSDVNTPRNLRNGAIAGGVIGAVCYRKFGKSLISTL